MISALLLSAGTRSPFCASVVLLPVTVHSIINYWTGYFRRSVFKTYRFLKHPRKLKKSPLMRWFARHFLDKHVWKPTRHTFAGGLAIGMFITVQLLPGQMPAAAILAAIFRVNIPIALAACWLSNPFTYAIMIPAEYQVGKWMLSWFSEVPITPFPKVLPEGVAETWLAFKEHAPVMLFGGLVVGALLAPISYVTSFVTWRMVQKWNKARVEPSLPLSEVEKNV